MKIIPTLKSLILVVLLALSAGRVEAAPVGTAFTYQGFLTLNGVPAKGAYEMIFRLFQQGAPAPGPVLSNDNVMVAQGVFIVSLDFGMGVFDGTAYELGIAVRERGGGAQFVVLEPRQPLSATPNSIHAQTVSSVPDSALSANVALLDGSPVFTSGISVITLRVADAAGGGVLRFGPTDDCSIGVAPQGPTGLLLRDPRGVRILNPEPGPTRLLFGPTDDCSIGIDPAFPGLVERDPIGFRLLGRNNQGCRLIFGPTMDCTVEVDPAGPQGLLLRDPSGIRILSPDPMKPPTLRFGPTDDCSLGIDPVLPGLILRDPSGVRIAPADPTALPRLLFGPTDDCSIGIDPAFPGLVERDPIGFRLLGRNNQGCRLIFGPTMDCTVEVDPGGPQGLLLRDPRGIRILPPDLADLPLLRFGPTDDCSIGIDPAFPGLVERDPIGFRLLGRNNQGCRLIFGPTMDCTVEVDPGGPQGLLLRDPSGIRILSPDAMKPPTLRFGPTDDCSIGIDPVLSGLTLRDPRGLRIAPADPAALPRLLFGPTDDCSIGIDPAFPGLVERDPIGFRLLGRNNQGCRLIFGPTMDCTVEVDPGGPQGLLLRDPRGIRILPRNPADLPVLRFGPTDDCSIGIDPVLSGLRLRDPGGLRIAPTAATALPRLLFGPTDDCSIGIDPAFPGLVERDPIGLRLLGKDNKGGRLIFGPTDDCSIEVRPPGVAGAVPGLLLRDPSGIRVLSPDSQRPPILLFGPTDDCSIGIDPVLPGLRLRDPGGLRIASTSGGTPPRLLFGPTLDCSIVADVNLGMRFSDPRGFTFANQVTVNGPVFAQAFIQTSSRRFKHDVKPIEQPLEKISQLQGVRFTWNKEKGGREDLGFIAEEVAKVIPEVVAWEEDGQNARGVNYDHLVAVAIEGIKAQQSQIQTLEREKAELKESLGAMQARLDRLSQQMETLMAR